MKRKCDVCQMVTSLPDALWDRHVETGVELLCMACRNDILRKSTEVLMGDDKKLSKEQEKRAAERYGGSTQLASGALPGIKGDVRAPGMRVECKLTRSKSYTLKLEDLKTLEGHAEAGEDPVFEIEFIDAQGRNHRYVVLPGWVFDQYRETKNGSDKDHRRPAKRRSRPDKSVPSRGHRNSGSRTVP